MCAEMMGGWQAQAGAAVQQAVLHTAGTNKTNQRSLSKFMTH